MRYPTGVRFSGSRTMIFASSGLVVVVRAIKKLVERKDKSKMVKYLEDPTIHSDT